MGLGRCPGTAGGGLGCRSPEDRLEQPSRLHQLKHEMVCLPPKNGCVSLRSWSTHLKGLSKRQEFSEKCLTLSVFLGQQECSASVASTEGAKN